ncbi:MAG: YdeI/OmpD-associated family protein [Bacteroidales bacterium]|nr:YdeI/OmpD-associated family protein [Bacteroidales bacterium]MCF8455351.1 YdeI/OmpD-associated family protein [Bacteroidales bacterium]
MEIINPIYFTDRKQWRAWLWENFDKEKEVWLIYPHKDTGKARILYNDAVEEALCFGWIDSTIKSYNEVNSAQRFTPRRPKSTFSQPNKERLKWLAKHNMLYPTIEDSIKDILEEEYVFPDDIIAAIAKDKKAWANFIKFPEAYRRIRVAYIEASRNSMEHFNKRLAHFIKSTRENKLVPGFGGIEKYYF